MAIETMRDQLVIPAREDAIRIVPLHVPDEVVATAPGVAPPPAPQLTYRGGPLMTAVQVFTLFWGPAWQAAQAQLADQLNSFFDFILTSPLIDQLKEYDRPGLSIGYGSRIGTATILRPSLRRTVSDSAVRHLLQQEIATNPALPQPTANTLYFVFLPTGVSLTQGGGRSCLTFCGYHDAINGQIFYAVMPFPGCAGCLGGLSTLDALTSTSSHELCESITDPVPGQGWSDDVHGEIGDICAWKTKQLGPYTVQLEWSNAASSCV
jgi:hypothetical protein